MIRRDATDTQTPSFIIQTSSLQKACSLYEFYLQIPIMHDRSTTYTLDGAPPVCLVSHAAALRHTPTNRGDDIVTRYWLPSARPACGLIYVLCYLELNNV
jgi:hypothetical protein